MNTLQALSVQLIISVQQFYYVIQVYNKGQVQYLYYQMGTISQLTFMLHIENTSVQDNHKG